MAAADDSTGSLAAPIGADEFAALMEQLGPFSKDRRLVAGVSGGADSMALALLLSRWGRPLACVVDHGLRERSAAEAGLVASRLATLGIEAHVRRACIAPGAGRAAKAREARYALLMQACRDAGCADLVVAHHAGDQAETVRMREHAGSGPAGLAGMAMITGGDSARLLRPLLRVPPARLRATLQQAGVPWIEDPTNNDLRTKRAQLRQEMDDDDCFTCCAAADMGGAARHRADQGAAEELATVSIFPEGFAHVPGPLSPDALSSLIWSLSGQPYPPPRRSVLSGLRRSVLHGVIILPAGRFGPGWLLAREPAAVAPPVAAVPGARWDGRFSLRGTPPSGTALGALGDDAARLRQRSVLPSVVLRGLPAVRLADELIAVTHLGFPDQGACHSLTIEFSPAHLAAGGPFVPA